MLRGQSHWLRLAFRHGRGRCLWVWSSSASMFPLGEQELLLTFDTHALHRRESTFGRDWKPRTVRAVVLSRVDGRVLLVRDWTVSDDLDMPVWSIGNGDVIAHVGRELVDYGPDLTEVRRVQRCGPGGVSECFCGGPGDAAGDGA